jgi:simple sugar transport system ATP-binding protein
MLGESRGLTLPADAARRRLNELASTLGVELDPNAEVQKLALGQQQQVEIIKALWRGSRVLILDEPTSMLTPQGVEDLQRVLVRLKGHGLAIIFITHKLHEALAIGDRISILKQGRLIATFSEETLRSQTPEQLRTLIVETMFGEEARAMSRVAELQGEMDAGQGRSDFPGTEIQATGTAPAGEVALELVDVSARPEGTGPGVQDVSLVLHKGEILGIAGVDGNGQRELAEVIAGQRPLSAGRILLQGRAINRMSVSRRQRLGLRYVTDDRLGEGIVHSMSVAMNLVLKRIGQSPFWRNGIVQQAAVNQLAQELVKRFDVRTPSVTARVGTLSGGNIQKVLLARELSLTPQVVVYNKPTQGLDVKTTRLVRDRIRGQASEGISAIVISTDLDELLELCDRIAVLYHGRLAGTVENSPGAGERIGELMIGGKAA